MGLAGVGWLVAGVLVHLSNQLARAQGWYTIIRAACPESAVRRRDAVAAWVAGAGAAGVLSARGGDAIRLVLLRPRTGEAGYPVLAGTIVADGAGEAAIGVTLLSVAIAFGLAPGFGAPAPWLFAALALLALAASRFGAVRRCARGVAQGACALRSPGLYCTRVVPWLIASRLARGVAIACFLAAFGLPATVPAVLLVMFAQVGGRAIPFAPASLGAGAAILAAAFEPVTGSAADPATVLAFYVVTSGLLTVIGVVLAIGIAARRTTDYSWARRPLASWKRRLETRPPSRQTL